MNTFARKFVVPALSLSLMALPLAACGGQQSTSAQESSASSNASNSASDSASSNASSNASNSANDSASSATNAEAAAGDYSSLKTLGDAMSVETDSSSYAWNENTYLYVFNSNSAPVRVVAKLTPELYTKLSELDSSVSDFNVKVLELLGSVELTKVDDLSKGIPAQAELDKFVGKKGQDMLNDGYKHFYLMAFGDDVEAQAVLEKGDYQYAVTFNEHVSNDTDDTEDAIKNLTVKSVQYFDLSSDAMNPDKF